MKTQVIIQKSSAETTQELPSLPPGPTVSNPSQLSLDSAIYAISQTNPYLYSQRGRARSRVQSINQTRIRFQEVTREESQTNKTSKWR